MADDPKLVTALEVRLNTFEKQLKEAGLIAEREVKNIEDKFAKANPVFGGTFLGTFLGNAARDAAKELISFVTDLVARFKDLAYVSKLANVAMQDMFGLQEAAAKLGAPIAEVTNSVRTLAELLDRMKRGENNSLAKLIELNPAAFKGLNIQAATFEEILGRVANLVRNARTEIQKIDIAKAAGQAESMIPLLEKGAAQMTKLQKAAADAAPDLQKLANQAKDFDIAWKAAIDNLKAYLITGFHDKVLDQLEAILGLIKSIAEIAKGGIFAGGPLDTTEAIKNIEAVQAKLKAYRESAAEQRELDKRRSGDVPGGGTTTRDPNAPLSNAPVRIDVGDERSRLTAAIDRIEKRTAVLQKENETINLGTQARQEAIIKEELLTIAKQQSVAVTPAQLKAIDDVAAAYGRAAAQIENARSPLATFARESANLGKMLNDVAAGALNNMTNELANVVTGTKTAAEAFGAMAKSIANDLAKIAIRQAITGPLAQALGMTGAFNVGGGRGFADGGTLDAGGWGVVGERGPEIIRAHRGGGVTVFPNGKLPGFADGGYLPAPMGGGATVQGAQITINAPGADKEGLARVEAEVIKLNRSIETRAVRAVSDASSRGHTVITRR